jgi:hypothetical protein
MAGCASAPLNKRADNQTLSPPSSQTSRVVFLRPSMFGYAISAVVFDVTNEADPKLLGISSASSKMVYDVPPGPRRFMVYSEAADFMDANDEANERVLAFHASQGTTALAATTLSGSPADLKVAVEAIARTAARAPRGAEICGVHLEGPYINRRHAGAQDAAGNQVQHIFLGPDKNGVPGVVAALRAHHHIGLLGQHVDDFSLPFVAPLRPNQNSIRHNSRSSEGNKKPRNRKFGATLGIYTRTLEKPAASVNSLCVRQLIFD